MYNLSDLTQLKKLAVGGQKTVFLAYDKIHGNVIYKVGVCDSPSSLERIKREIEILQNIDSLYFPHNYYFTIEEKDKKFHIVEEYIEGNTLEKINFVGNENLCIKLLKQLITALSPLWERKIVHRDIKPQNIIMRNDGNIVVIDFGIARILDKKSLTQTINMMGPCTPCYAAPEQLINAKKKIDKRTDFFALGILILEKYLGYHPFDPNHVSGGNIPQNIINSNFEQPQKCTQAFSELCEKLLANRQYKRFINANVFLEYLESNWEV